MGYLWDSGFLVTGLLLAGIVFWRGPALPSTPGSFSCTNRP